MNDQLVYHYTSLETFHKIISKSSCEFIKLRATHIEYLNDYSEHKIAVKLLKDKLIEFDNKQNPKKDLENLLTEKNISFFRYDGIDDLYPFVTCFSEEKDSIPMWRSYANDGKGIALGFQADNLNKLHNCELKKCDYTTQAYENYLDTHISKIYSAIDVNAYSSGMINKSEVLQQHFEMLPILKDKSFTYENEHRLIVPNKINDLREVEFHATQTLLKPYKLVKIPKSYLKEIVVGPCLDFEKIKSPLAIFMNQKNLKLSFEVNSENIHLIKSEAPYRNI